MKRLIGLFLMFLCLSNIAFSYDAVIKDKYGRVTGYLDKDDGKTYILDKYGRRGDYIEEDGDIKDKYGNKKGTIERK